MAQQASGASASPSRERTRGHTSQNPNEITIHNFVVILIDHQPWVAFSVRSTPRMPLAYIPAPANA